MPRKPGRTAHIVSRLLADETGEGLTVAFGSKKEALSCRAAFYTSRARSKRQLGYNDPKVLKLYSYTVELQESTDRRTGEPVWLVNFIHAERAFSMEVMDLTEGLKTFGQVHQEEKPKLKRKGG